MAAVGGIIAASRASSVDPNTGGSNVLLYAVGAAVIGGTSLFGGKGRVLDAVLGGAVVAVIDNGMGLLGYSAGVKYIVTGVGAAARRQRRRAVPPPRGRHRHRAEPTASRTVMAPACAQDPARRRSAGRTSAPCCGYVHVHGATSRAELTTALGLNRSTIGALTADLTAAGLVSEGRRGRPAGPDDRHWSSGPSRPGSTRTRTRVEVDRLRAARVGLGGAVLDRRELDRPRGDCWPRRSRRRWPASSRRCSSRCRPDAVCVGAGVAVCGMVRRDDGLVRLGPTIGWVDEPIGAALADRAAASTCRSRSATAPTSPRFAEHARGVAVGCDNVIYLYGDVGVGAGIIAGGRRLTGHGGYGGEVGHMVVVRDGTALRAAAPAAAGRPRSASTALLARRRPLRRPGPRRAAGGLRRRRPRRRAGPRRAVRQVGDWLGFGVANLVNIFNPEMVIFGGTMRDLYLAAAAQVRSRLNSNALPRLPRARPAAYPETRRRTRALIGAAELAFERLLADPLDVG